MGQHVLVLNATYEPLNITTVRRACVLLMKEKAELIEMLDRPMRSASATFPYPTVIRLVAYVRSLSGLTPKGARPSRDDHMMVKPAPAQWVLPRRSMP